MGKLILTSGERTNNPYVFGANGVRIYSIEELCYYLYTYVYLIDESMLSDDLFRWIDLELKLTDRARKLQLLKQQKADMKTLVTVILCSSDYYTEDEIKALLKLLDQIIGMPCVKRRCLKAKSYLNNKIYQEAAAEYEIILNSLEAAELTPEEYGDIYHNLAIAKLHLSGLPEAGRLFEQAFLRNQKEESLMQMLYTLKLSNKEDEYQQKIKEYQVSEEVQESIEGFLTHKEEEAKSSESMKNIDILQNMKALGKMSQYYQKADEMIDSWKAKLRNT